MAASTAEVRRLRAELESRFGRAILPVGTPEREADPSFLTGVGVLDSLLPDGVPRGALSLWTGARTSGRTAALRELVVRACAGGSAVALVDASRTLDASFGCTAAGAVEGLWVVCPPDAVDTVEGAWAAEALLRAGVFDLVILDGQMPTSSQAHRLRKLAREGDTALLISAPFFPLLRTSCSVGSAAHAAPVPSSLAFRADVRLDFGCVEQSQARGLMPGGRFRRRAWAAAVKGAGEPSTGGRREIELVHEPADRLCPGPPAPDRSGARR